MQWKRLVYFLLLNILVSAVTTLVVLTIWDRAHQAETSEPVSEVSAFVIPTETQVAQTAVPEVSLQPYQVGQGETLGEIALAFNVNLDELLVLNGLTDPNSIGAGATIFVPLEIEPEEPEERIDGGDPPPAMSTGQVEIVAVFGAGDLASERVQLRGLGEGTLYLTGWSLQDGDGNEYTFPKITLFGKGAVDVYSTAGVDSVVALYWNSGEAIWESAETLTLLDQAGVIQASYTVP
jgi:LysM repeat protein